MYVILIKVNNIYINIVILKILNYCTLHSVIKKIVQAKEYIYTITLTLFLLCVNNDYLAKLMQIKR